MLLGPAFTVSPVTAQTLPGQDAPRRITLEPGDVLQVNVWPDQELSGSFVVEETGFVHLPLLGAVNAADVRLDSLRVRLREGYSEVMQNPVVTVTPRYSVGVFGAVGNPGVYDVTPATTLFDVIGMAGGFRGADVGNIRIVQEERVVEVNALRALEAGLGQLPDVQLESGNQILVPGEGGVSFSDVLTILQTGATIGFLIDRVISN